MLVIFCEECGGKNMIDQETLEQLEEQSIDCQICSNRISMETVISYSGSEKSVNTKDVRLLFIDDDPIFLELMKSAITKEYKVAVALSGQEGMKMAEQLNPNIIFLDANMQGMDGYETCSLLKSNKKLRHIPVIFISAANELDEEWKGLSLGAVDYMTKPIDPKIFHARVGVHIRLQTLLNEHRENERDAQNLAKKLQENTLLLEQTQEDHNFAMMALKNGLNEVNQTVFLLDPNGKAKWINKKGMEQLGLPQKKIIGEPCSSFFCDTEEECAHCFEASMMENGQYQSIDHFSSKFQIQFTHKHIPVFDDEGILLSQIHIAAPSNNTQENGQLEEFITKRCSDIQNIVATLTAVSHSVNGSDTENEQLTDYSTYVTSSLEQLTEILEELKSPSS
jgi:DNA-binding response OmpR family regulator